MSTLTLTPKLQITQPPQAPIIRKTLSGVLWKRFLEWLENATARALWKAIRNLTILTLITALIVAYAPTVKLLTALIQWRGYKLPILAVVLTLVSNIIPIYKFIRRKAVWKRKGNQHTFHGFAVSELADLLTNTGAFKKEDAQKRLAMTHTQWLKIAEALEKNEVLTRGESNARVLRPITREELVKQLRENFPLKWDEQRKAWFERNGSFDEWTLKKEWKQRQIEQDVERKERKIERLDKKIQEHSAFQNILNMSAQ